MMGELSFERTPEKEKELHNRITKRITSAEKQNFKKKRYTGPDMQKRIKKIIEEEVAKV